MVNRKYDLGTAMYVASLQGANNITAVRVTDGTDTAAAAAITASGTAITFTSKYTGSFGDGITGTLTNGSASGSYALTIAAPGLQPERFDNLSGTGNALWVAMAAAVNAGQSGLRGPSQIVVATAGAGTGAPTLATTTLTGGTDGASGVTSATLIGADGTTRTGMYALRGTGCKVAYLADADDSTQWTLQSGFALSEGVYMVGTSPSGDSIAGAASARATAGIDSYGFKLMVGDWAIFQDQVNNVQRDVPTAGFIAGLLSAQSPQNSTLTPPCKASSAPRRHCPAPRTPRPTARPPCWAG